MSRALRGCQSFHPELELSSELEATLAAKIFLSDQPDLAEKLPRRTWDRTVAAGATIGLPELMVHMLSPGIAALLFAEPAETDPLATLDGRLYTAAQSLNLHVVPLESIDEQLDVFLKISDKAAIALLNESLDEKDAGYPEIDRLKHAYLLGDEKRLSDLLLGEFRKSPESTALAEPLLYQRNRIMAERAAPHLRAGGAFIAVGAGHLLGPKGLVEILRGRGRKITRVP